MKQLFLSFFIVLNFSACGQLDSLQTFTAKSVSVAVDKSVLLKDQSYGEHERNVFDIIKPEDSEELAPLVIFIHGGGFKHGSKEVAFEKYHKGIKKLLEKNIAFASINYRFLQHSEDGVMTSLNDSKMFLQFIRLNAE